MSLTACARGTTDAPGLRPAFLRLLVGPTVLLCAVALHARDVPVATAVGTLSVPPSLLDGVDVSGIARRGEFMLLAVDEGRSIQVLRQRAAGDYEIVETQLLLPWPEDKELDLEGLAWTSTHVYAIGSHSRKRKSVSVDIVDGKKASKNVQRLYETAVEPSREYLIRFQVGDNGKIKRRSIQQVSLRDLLGAHRILGRFQDIPGKENGIDIEAIARGDNDRIYLGLRGPVLRGGYVPILIVTVREDDGELELEDDIRFVHLGGRGVRGMARLPDDGDPPRFLVLAGPMGDGPGSYQLYEWDGENAVPGKDRPREHDHAMLQCEIPPPAGEPSGKAEGIAVVEAAAHSLSFVVVYDGAIGGAATLFTCPRTATGGSS